MLDAIHSPGTWHLLVHDFPSSCRVRLSTELLESEICNREHRNPRGLTVPLLFLAFVIPGPLQLHFTLYELAAHFYLETTSYKPQGFFFLATPLFQEPPSPFNLLNTS